MNAIRFFDEITPADDESVGGKGASLARMARGGLPVPPGFCITSEAYRAAHGTFVDVALRGEVAEAYRKLGGGHVAVRSSATAEDGAEASFAGQQETILGVTGEADVLDAVARCWASLHTDRAKAYRAKQGVADDAVAMGVVVQTLVPADVAGVLFTRDPLDPTGQRMLIEASWGLGESVVSGRVTPDRFHVDRDTGRVADRALGTKSEKVVLGKAVAASDEEQKQFCLTDEQLAQLAELGRKVAAFYGDERDVEWAFAGGTFWLLQARPITTVMASEREAARREEMRRLKTEAGDPAKEVWVRYNLAESLPDPTPMTWALVQRMLAPDGGMGLMNRDFGATPDPALGGRGPYELIAGRPYANLGRMLRMQSANAPFAYPVAAYKANPALALDPKPKLKLINGFASLFTLPFRLVKLMATGSRTEKLAATFAERFRTEIIPAFVAETRAAGDFDGLSVDALLARLEHWTRRTLVEFARDSLKPTVFADTSWQVLFQALKRPLGEERARAALGEIALGARPDPDADLPGALKAAAAGVMPRDEFLANFGHRGSHEMELSAPRWSEDAAAVDRLLASVPKSSPLRDDWEARWEAVADEAKFGSVMRPQWKKHAERLRTYLGLREAGKHHLMRGYALIRNILVALDRKLDLGGLVFFVDSPELPRIGADRTILEHARRRRKERAALLSLEVPPVLFGDDLEAIGRPAPLPEGDHLRGVALSAGVAEAPALVLTEPTNEIPKEGYVLVCPSTDPAWVPLFTRAKALVMETGGVLSHGAIVAREFGLPAVAGLPGVVRRLRTGDRLRVDGAHGTVTVLP